jgi:inhibitor of KinA
VKFSPLGDSALLIDFVDESSDSAVLLPRALSAADTIAQAKIPGIIEATSAYQSVAVFFHGTNSSSSELIEQISALFDSSVLSRPRQNRLIQIPVCYDSDFALDAIRVVTETKLPLDKIVALHSVAEFTVACIGFMPGFPYLAGLPAQLHAPRLPTPRTKVPAGSVAIANAQAGIYPVESPGGWNVIGRTPVRLFDPAQTPPTLLVAGDRVRFRPITRDEFEAIAISNEQ